MRALVNGLYKAEVIWRRGPWRSFEQVEFATLESVSYTHLTLPTDGSTPASFKRSVYLIDTYCTPRSE